MILEEILQEIVADPMLHAKWLNTLSYMENAGARKISAAEHKQEVTLIVLKHAAEEHRHAYYLKKQISKIDEGLCPTYKDDELLTANHTKYYLNQLDVSVCRYLKSKFGKDINDIKFAAYLFVTYAIEVRADELYPVYQQVLDAHKSKVNVKSIILEEEGHLEEMIAQLQHFSPDWKQYADEIVAMESRMYEDWLNALKTLTVQN